MLDSVKHLADAAAMPEAALAATVAAVRRFSRFYTRRIGLLQDGLLDSPFSLAEGRVLYELGQCGSATAAELAAELGLDQGYLSRILRGFDGRGLLERVPSDADRRATTLSLTKQGREFGAHGRAVLAVHQAPSSA